MPSVGMTSREIRHRYFRKEGEAWRTQHDHVNRQLCCHVVCECVFNQGLMPASASLKSETITKNSHLCAHRFGNGVCFPYFSSSSSSLSSYFLFFRENNDSERFVDTKSLHAEMNSYSSALELMGFVLLLPVAHRNTHASEPNFVSCVSMNVLFVFDAAVCNG